VAKPPSPRPNENGGHHSNGGKPPSLTASQFILVCERYAETGLAIASCEDLGFSYSAVTTAIRDMTISGDDTWQELWDESHAKFKESLNKAIFTRGRDGTPTKWRVDPKTGERTAIEWEYSDRLLELAAKGHMPELYRDKIFVSGSVGLEPVDAFSNLSTKAKREIRAIIMRDLEEQRELAAAQSKGELIEHNAVAAIADLGNNEEDGA
jgi:hypothetical protein